MSSKPNATISRFGYPETLIREYSHWVVLLRPQQATLGALVMACKEEAQAFSRISTGAFAEQQKVVSDIEAGLKSFRPFQKINYLMLMMVDKEVHYHVLPRYEADQNFEGRVYKDAGWPALPDLSAAVEPDAAERAALVAALKAAWPS